MPRALRLLGWLGWLAAPAYLLGLEPWSTALLGMLAGVLALAASDMGRSAANLAPVAPRELPTARETGRYAQVWDLFQRDQISAVSALLRVEQLFAARVAEIEDWDALDWTISPLGPVGGSWRWEGDRLSELSELEELEDSVIGTYAVPGHDFGPPQVLGDPLRVLREIARERDAVGCPLSLPPDDYHDWLHCRVRPPG